MATSNAGLHVSALLCNGATEARVLDHCRPHGVAVGGLGAHWAHAGQPPGLVIGFGNIATTDVTRALEVLADALRDAATGDLDTPEASVQDAVRDHSATTRAPEPPREDQL